MWHFQSKQKHLFDFRNKLFSGSNRDPLFTVYYQMLPAFSQTAPSLYTLSYPCPPSTNRSSFAYVRSFRKHILSQVTDVLTSPGSYVILWLWNCIGTNHGTSLAYPQQFSKPMLSVLKLHHGLSVEFCVFFFKLDRLSINHTELQIRYLWESSAWTIILLKVFIFSC